MINHNRIYTAILGALAVYLIIPGIGMLLFLTAPQHPTTRELGIHLPDWSIPFLAVAHVGYATAIGVVLLARRLRPDCGCWLTRVLNWALLPALPAGLVLGLYGLCKVDKQTTAN